MSSKDTSKNSASAIAAPVDDSASGMSAPPQGWKQSVWKNYGLAMIVEFIGTFLFLLFAFGGTQAAKTNWDPTLKSHDPILAPATQDLLLYVAFAFGFSLTVNVWVFYRVSGGLFNPAITLGCVVVGGMSPLKGGLLATSQLLGGIAASGMVQALLPIPLAVGTSLAPGVSTVQGLFIEMFLTAQLMITIFLLAVEKHRGTYIAPLGIGLSFFITQLFGVYFTGGSLNPARSFGPAVVTGDFPSYHWIYWLGPVLGACLAAGVYKFLLFAEYQTINPGQDNDGLASCESLITAARRAGKVPDLENANGAGPSRDLS
ncbi:Aquaporin-1 [Maublancomyces gigas]|uniref:Aquaporin-1 n=1 Tax=Discina gigas TaxID=1032678 RepID=A0ABR3GKQ5_9PEZI